REVKALQKGRTEARESAPVRPAPDADVAAALPFLSRQLRAVVELQRLTGMRSGEVVVMRTGDLDRSGPVWTYTPGRHKGEHRGKSRQVTFGPRAQEVLKRWLRADPAAYLFSPKEAEAERREARRAGRNRPMTPSQRARRRKAGPSGRRATTTPPAP